MTSGERLAGYIHSLDTGHGEFLDGVARQARAANIPIIRSESAAFLQTLVAAKQPRAILEVGAAVGYSALLMAQVVPAHCHITTIEKYGPRIQAAKENLRLGGAEGRITLLEGDADEILPSLSGFYDFIFMDAAKGQYPHFLPIVLGLLPDHGMLVSDNVLQGGDIIESRFAVERRNRTIHGRMREYLFTLTHTDGLVSSVIPIGDGMTVSVKER